MVQALGFMGTASVNVFQPGHFQRRPHVVHVQAQNALGQLGALFALVGLARLGRIGNLLDRKSVV